MRVFLTGGTGSIGSVLARRLAERGDEVRILTRDLSRAGASGSLPGVTFLGGDPRESGAWQEAVEGCDAVVNLVGHKVFGERWNHRVKQLLRESRVEPARRLAEAVQRCANPPRTFVQGSAIGYYGDGGEAELTEESPPGRGFLAELSIDWEAAARPVEDCGTRLAFLRTGVVLARGSGALGAMEPIFKWVPGGAAPVGGSSAFLPGTGRQWMSWIHMDDLVGIIMLLLDHNEASGPVNGTAPNPVRYVEFARELARVLKRPFLPLGPPTALLRLIMGEVAMAISESQRVLPRAAERWGYAFRFPELRGALNEIYGVA